MIKAANNLQQQLGGSAAQPAVVASSGNAADAHDDCPVAEEAFLAELRSRQRQRTTKRGQRRTRAIQRQSKRTFCAVFRSVEQPASKRNYEDLSSKLIQACADEPLDFVDRDLEISGGASSNSVGEHAQHRQRKMARLVIDLQNLTGSAWKAVNDEESA